MGRRPTINFYASDSLLVAGVPLHLVQEDAKPLVEADELPPQRHAEIVCLQSDSPQATFEDFAEII